MSSFVRRIGLLSVLLLGALGSLGCSMDHAGLASLSPDAAGDAAGDAAAPPGDGRRDASDGQAADAAHPTDALDATPDASGDRAADAGPGAGDAAADVGTGEDSGSAPDAAQDATPDALSDAASDALSDAGAVGDDADAPPDGAAPRCSTAADCDPQTACNTSTGLCEAACGDAQHTVCNGGVCGAAGRCGPGCGDGVVAVAAGEQCDHGVANGTPADGCSATCQLADASYLDEIEQNDTQGTATNLDGYAGGVGALAPAGDADWYAVAVTVPGSSIWAFVDDGFGACPGGADPLLQLHSPTGTLLVSDDNGGAAPCPRIDPTAYALAANLPVGQYGLTVMSAGANGTAPYYVVHVRVVPPSCGDGVVQNGEQCDTGPNPNPGCSPTTCQLTGDFTTEIEPNDTQALANPLRTHAGFTASINPAGDLDYFSFDVPGPRSLVTITIGDGVGGCPAGFDSLLLLFNPGGALLLQDDNGGVGGCSKISAGQYPQAANLAAGTYKARVEFRGNIKIQPSYVATISVTSPACGDGVVSAGEQCDDGGASAGCSATCQSLPPWEIEPNGGAATATPAWPQTPVTWKGAIAPLGDRDYFTFTLAAPGTITLLTHAIGDRAACSGDTMVHLLDASGTPIAQDDDSGPGACSQLVQALTAAGTYYAWVQSAGDQATIASYQLDLTVQ